MADEPIVVVGGGLAAGRLAQEYRAAEGEALVTLVSSDDAPPYHRPPLTKGFLRGEAERDDTLIRPAEEWEDDLVELRLGSTVAELDVDAAELVTDGGERIPYGTLVLATGARPRVLPIPGADRVGVHTYRTLADADAVRTASAEAHKTLVIGGSFIGAEVAASLRLRGLDVMLVELGERLMPALACTELSVELEQLYRDEGIELRLETELEELVGNGRLLGGARTSTGETIECYLAVMGVGVEPNVELAEAAGATIDDGIVVDERFCSSLDGIYAIGDVAKFPEPVSGRLRRIEHWSNANAQGGHLGRQLAGKRARYDEVPVFFTQLFDRKLQVLGDPAAADACVLRGSLADGRLIGFHLDGSKLVGAVVHGEAADVLAELEQLLRDGATIDDQARLTDEHLRPAAAFGV